MQTAKFNLPQQQTEETFKSEAVLAMAKCLKDPKAQLLDQVLGLI